MNNNNTFLNVDASRNNENYDTTIFGLDFITAPWLEGTKTAADKIRELSFRYANSDGTSFPIKIYNPERGYILDKIRINDYGNINFMTNDLMIENVKFPIFIGSDHGATFYILKKLYSDNTLKVLQFDAHSDYLDEFEECPHGSVMNKVKTLNNVKEIIHCGLRGNLNTGPGIEKSKQDGNVVVTKNELSYETIVKNLDETDNIYISIDTDFFDPSIAPGTCNPEPDGFMYEEFRKLITNIIKKYNVIGIDIVEYNPSLDYSNITGNLIVNIIIEIISAKFYGAKYGKYIRK